MKAAFYTLGCKVNQNETAVLEHLFQQGGFEIAAYGEKADIYIVNSCTVTAEGEAKSRRWLRRAKRENPQAVTVLTGCFPQAFPEESLLFGADVVTGTVARSRLLQNLQTFLDTGNRVIDIIPHSPKEDFEKLPTARMRERTRAFIKIQDGCNRRCAYCIIPSARGPARSRTEEDILQEIQTLAGSGSKEIVFTGINLPSYGKDTGSSLAHIIEKSAKVEGICRIRLSSLDPDYITPEQIHRFAKVPTLCPQFHLSLQSGCDATLKRMRRPYTASQYRTAATTLRGALPNATLTTDIIVGFPGETEEEFQQSLAFVKEMRFLKVHVFPFSPRPGTPAADFTGQLPRQEKTRRAKIMQNAADEIRRQEIATLEGTRQEILLELPTDEGLFTGYTKQYIPVLVNAPGHTAGDIIPVILGKLEGERCSCTIITE